MPLRLLRALRCAATALAFLLPGVAVACPLCFSGLVITPGQKLDAADRAVLAEPDPAGGYRIVAVVKGSADGADGMAPIAEVVASPAIVAPLTAAVPAETGPAERPRLLVRNAVSDDWSDLGAVAAEFAPWLASLAATNRTGDAPAASWPQTIVTWASLTDEAWRERLALVAPMLENAEPLVAEFAYGELSRAPYAVMRSLADALDPATVAGWVADPELAARRPGYLLLLGIVGGAREAALVEAAISAAMASGDATELGVLLAADLEQRGASRVDWLAVTFFTDPARSLAEIEAARLALSVHGTADATVPRARVVDAYRLLIRARPPMAGFVATDLTDWQAWEATADYLAVMRTDAVKDPASQLAINLYLRSSPDSGGARLPN